jgi:acid phosphatase
MPRLLAAALAAATLGAGAAVALAAPPPPPQPRPVVVEYYDSGSYTRDTVPQLRKARRALRAELRTLEKGRKPALVLDIDDTSLSQYPCRKPGDLPFDDGPAGVNCVMSGALPPIVETRQLYQLALRRGVKVFFITGRVPQMRDATIRNLREAGFTRYQKLVMRPTADLSAPSVIPFKAGQRRKIERAGYDILVNVGDQDSDLAGGYANRTFKLPNPMYFIP